MEIVKESKLNEAKEKLPVSFLTDFVSKGWEEVGYLKADIDAIKEAYSGTGKIEELIQGLIDAYLVCIGQMELHINDKKYLDYPEESGLAKKESLSEAVDIHVEGNEVTIADASGEDVAIIPVEPEAAVATEEPVCVGPECEVPSVVAPIEPIVVSEPEPLENPFTFDGPEAEGVSIEKPAPVGDTFEYFVDFDEPVGEPVTEKELYGEGEAPIEGEKIDDGIEPEEEKKED